MAEGITLYGSPENYQSKGVEIALTLKGVEYAYREEDWRNPSPLVAIHSPILLTVPILVHRGKSIVGTLPILEYVEETWKNNPILPQEPSQRAQARFWVLFIDMMCMPSVMAACCSGQQVFSPSQQQTMAIKQACVQMKILEGELRGKKFFGGETIGIVDIAALPIAFWLGALEEVTGVKLLKNAEFPELCRWINDFINDKEITKILPPRDKLITYFRTFLGFGNPFTTMNNNAAMPGQPFANSAAIAGQPFPDAALMNNAAAMPGQPSASWGANTTGNIPMPAGQGQPYFSCATANYDAATPGQPFANWGANAAAMNSATVPAGQPSANWDPNSAVNNNAAMGGPFARSASLAQRTLQ